MESDDSAANLLQRGLENYDSNNYEEAIKFYDEAIKLSPDYPEAWYNKGLALTNLQRYEQAIECYRKANEIAPGSDAWYNMGLNFYRLKRFEEAIEAYDKATKIEPNYDNAWYNRGLALYDLKKYEEAIKSYEEAIKIRSDSSDVWYSKGLALEALKKYEEAIAAYDKSIEINPNYYDVWYGKGVSFAALKKYEQAIDSYDKALNINPSYGNAWYREGIALESLGRKAEAVKYFEKARDLGPGKEPYRFILNNLSPNVASDIYATEDTLEYQRYADAIAEVLTNKNTKPPIAISIQASWGSGKTTLMRLVRNKLDPFAAAKEDIDKDYAKTTSKVSLRKLKNFLKGRKASEKQNKLILPAHALPMNGLNGGHVTIWFNAWKYENTEQIWSGLADSIVRGVADRMSDNPLELQWYLLQLNLHREGADNVLNWITSHTLSYLWQRIYPIVWASVAAIIISAIISLFHQFAGVFGVTAALGVGGFSSFVKKLDIESKPPDMTLGEALKMPDYSKKLGYIHATIEDLQIIFRTIPNDYRPVIIFVDDLDRCSPKKVAEVIEGINLFLAGDFQAKFVIGMDAEMVAASLEAAHSQTISKLPGYSKQVSVGWRYMDKFIQLPILLPPIREVGLRKYVQNIMVQDIPNQNREDVNSLNHLKAKNQPIVDETQRITDAEGPTIEKSSSYDDDPELINIVSKAAAEFSINPRDIKRFVNLLRYYYVLRKRMLQKYPDQDLPTMDQLRRWILLMLNWPQLVRWIYLYESRRNELDYNSTSRRLLQLEKLAQTSKNETDWVEKLKSELNISEAVDGVSSWVTDKNLRQFFQNESQTSNKKPLSSSAGLGLY